MVAVFKRRSKAEHLEQLENDAALTDAMVESTGRLHAVVLMDEEVRRLGETWRRIQRTNGLAAAVQGVYRGNA